MNGCREMKVRMEVLMLYYPGRGTVISVTCSVTVFRFVWLFGWLDRVFWKSQKSSKRKVSKGKNEQIL